MTRFRKNEAAVLLAVSTARAADLNALWHAFFDGRLVSEEWVAEA